MTRLTPQPRRKVIRVLRKLGFVEGHSRGSHITYVRLDDDPPTLITVLYDNRDVGVPQLKEIMKIAGLSREEFLRLLKNE